ncbi:MAG: YtxH domain-containing protein [Candidatus Margulisbacteria bacterium]|nr:YtxH domain-containing protein [Candidatus Margulisiibacteriota bacterium]MBU1616837.1 YtxH domain-containing protein [Candidatus Margulisiibacteriota bacterium]
MPEQEDNTLLVGLLAGGLIGGVLGLMISPSISEKTRGTIKKKIHEFNLGEVLDRFAEAFCVGLEEAEKIEEELEGG